MVGRGLLAPVPTTLKEFSAQELWNATAGFSPICLIGEGGFGKVFRAMVHSSPVAIKVLDHEGLQGLRQFHTEMQLLAGLDHPHVVRLIGYAASPSHPAGPTHRGSGGCQALVYELMTRGNLEERLAPGAGADPLFWTTRVRVATQTCCALAYLHSKGIIHRDIKPANVFITADYDAKLGDIGLAVLDSLNMQSTLRRAQAGADEAIGTYCYLAPEYIKPGASQGRSSTRTDAYAMGLTLLQLLTGAEKPSGLVQKAEEALRSWNLARFLDPSAGAWDLRIGERLVKLALWLCMHEPDARPALSVVQKDMERLLAGLWNSDSTSKAAPLDLI